MHRYRLMFAAILVAILIVGLDIENAIYHPESIPETPDGLLPLVDSRDLLQRALSEDPPRTPVDLRNLVIELQNATPIVNRTDYDNDLLYDPVEKVIGTDPTRNDTDSDQISDYFEAMNGTDPLLPDSNYDGIFDFDEVNVTLDLDEDGVPNAWDFDNDGDGVNDDPDLSPFACSEVMSEFNISIQTDGMPTMINIQLTPQNVEHLKLFYQTWNWPDDDEEGIMQDRDASVEDLTITPLLRITTDQVPSESALTEMNVISSSEGLLIKLTPVLEYDTIVAYMGRLLYNDSVPSSIDLTAELIWEVEGATDADAKTLKSGDEYLSVGEGMIAICNESNIDNALPVEWIQLYDYHDRVRFAMKILNGPYLTVAPDGKTLVFNSTTLGDRERFLYYNAYSVIEGFNNNFMYITPDGTIELRYTPRSHFDILDILHTSKNRLVSYKEPFRITGLTVEEFYGTDVGCFYNTTNKTQTIAANWYMTYRFVNNATTTLADMPNHLQFQNVSVSSSIETVRDRYQAVAKLCNEMFPAAMNGVPSDEHFPIIASLQDISKMLDLSDILQGTYILNNNPMFDLTSIETVTSKSLKMNWYNTTTKVALAPIELCVEVALMGLSDMASVNLLAILLRWDTGIHQITKIGTVDEIFQEPSGNEIDVVQHVLTETLEFLNFAGKVVFAFKAWKELNIYVKNMESVTEVSKRLQWIKNRFGEGLEFADLVKNVGKDSKFCTWLKYSHWINANRNTKFMKYFKGFEKALFVIGILVDLGLSIWTGFAIADQIGGQTGREFGTIYGVTAAIIGLIMLAVLLVIEEIPLVGWLIVIAACIADMVGGYSSKLIEFLTKLFFGVPCQDGFTTPKAYLDAAPDSTIIDSDNNGFTLGDALKINGSLWAAVEATVYEAFLSRVEYHATKQQIAQFIIGQSIVLPSVEFNPPNGIFYSQSMIVSSGLINQTMGTGPYRYESRLKFDFEALIAPEVAMKNYPITLRVHYPYLVYNYWEHYVMEWFGLFGGDCYHTDPVVNLTTCYDAVTYYYDVFPSNLDSFLSWNVITANDPDGDQLPEAQELANGLSPWNYDSDGDNLNDRYELDNGLDATKSDSDMDGVSDWYEHVYGTNATNSDSDEDGVSDFDEISGWVINFNYLNNDSLRFQIPVTSNPKNNDSDGDGIDDYTEYRANTNPRSNDTNGDGIPDLSYAWFNSEANYETYIDWTMDGSLNKVNDICVDSEGYVYANGIIDSVSGNNTIRKYDSSLTQVTLPFNSVFNNMTFLPSGSRLVSMAVDESNNWLYSQVAPFSSNDIMRFNLSGTEINPGSWSPILNKNITDLDIGQDGTIYAAVRDTGDDQIGGFRTYSSDGTILGTYGNRGPADDQTDWITSIAVDEKYGYVYLCDKQFSYGKTDRVVIFRITDGAYLGTLSEDYVSIIDVDVDSEGYVYVLGELTDGMCVQKFFPDCTEDTDFRFYGNGVQNFTTGTYALGSETHQLALGPDKSIYVLDWTVLGNPSTSRIWKFSQTVELQSDLVPETDTDWDNDGLTNAQEMNGWEITVNFTTGEQTFLVTSNHLMNDTDLDGLGDYLEYTLGSNPRSSDTDQDGASDYREWWENEYPGVPYEPPNERPVMAPTIRPVTPMMWMAAGPSLNNWDSDGDMLGDAIELTFGSSPVNPDSDGEGLSDLNEFIYNSNPNSADSDNDGASDAYELAMNSSLLNADSDGDLIFDGVEYNSGMNPTITDQDGDGIIDGIELLYGSDPNSNDTDHDGIIDSVEISLWLNLLSNDTDGDGVLDGTEISEGTDPWLTDSDWDGIPDNEDPDTISPWGGHIALVYDGDAPNATIEFGALLGNYSSVTIFDADSFLDVEDEYQYVVLVGRPSSSATGTAGLVYHLLEDTGSMLTTMMDTEEDNIAVRYGLWTDPQTVVMMAGANTTDVATVLQILKYFEVSLLPDSVLVEFTSFEVGHNVTVDYAFPVNTIDTVKTTDTALLVQLSGPATPSIRITRYNQTTSPHLLTVTNGLETGDTPIGRYIDVSITISGTTQDVFESALILFYYRTSDLDLTANGVLGDVGDINETSLSLYYFDEIHEEWVKLNSSLSWVIGMGLNTTDINVYGENYAGYLWIQTTELSLFAIAGQTIHVGFGLLETIILVAILGVVGIVTIVLVQKWRKRRIEGKQMDLLSSLQSSLKMI